MGDVRRASVIEGIAQTSLDAKPVTSGWERARNRTPNSNPATQNPQSLVAGATSAGTRTCEFLDIFNDTVNYIGTGKPYA